MDGGRKVLWGGCQLNIVSINKIRTRVIKLIIQIDKLTFTPANFCSYWSKIDFEYIKLKIPACAINSWQQKTNIIIYLPNITELINW